MTEVAKCLGTSDYPSNLKFGQELDSGMHTPKKNLKTQNFHLVSILFRKNRKKLDTLITKIMVSRLQPF